MSMDYINIGSSPADEPCAQVGSDDYDSQSRKECRALINQLRRQLGPEVGSAQLGIKSFPHDFGSYREVVCKFSDTDEEGMAYAFRCESELPENWDERAKAELAAPPAGPAGVFTFGAVLADKAARK